MIKNVSINDSMILMEGGILKLLNFEILEFKFLCPAVLGFLYLLIA